MARPVGGTGLGGGSGTPGLGAAGGAAGIWAGRRARTAADLRGARRVGRLERRGICFARDRFVCARPRGAARLIFFLTGLCLPFDAAVTSGVMASSTQSTIKCINLPHPLWIDRSGWRHWCGGRRRWRWWWCHGLGCGFPHTSFLGRRLFLGNFFRGFFLGRREEQGRC